MLPQKKLFNLALAPNVKKQFLAPICFQHWPNIGKFVAKLPEIFLRLKKSSCDKHSHDLVRALKDLVDPDVPKILLHWIIFQVPVAAKYLKGPINHLK